jgi:hypothetical protein
MASKANSRRSSEGRRHNRTAPADHRPYALTTNRFGGSTNCVISTSIGSFPTYGGHITFRIPRDICASARFETFDESAIVNIPLALKDELKIHPRITVQVLFGGTDVGFQVSADDIAEIHGFVADTLLPRFMRFFTFRTQSAKKAASKPLFLSVCF